MTEKSGEPVIRDARKAIEEDNRVWLEYLMELTPYSFDDLQKLSIQQLRNISDRAFSKAKKNQT